MTNKRFYNPYSTHRKICRDKLRYNKLLDEQEVVVLLNEQDEKIKELEQIILDLTDNQAVTVIKTGDGV